MKAHIMRLVLMVVALTVSGFLFSAGHHSKDHPSAIFEEIGLFNDGGMAVPHPAQDQPSKSSAAERLTTAINEHGLDTALKLFSELRENSGGYDFNRNEFNTLGHKLLDNQEYEAAVAVFNLNTEMFPDSPDVYYNLAKACMYTSDRVCAEKNLKVTLVKNPNHYYAKRILDDFDRRFERVSQEREKFYLPGEQTGLKGPYLGQKPPGLTAEIFAPGIVSKALGQVVGCTFSPDGTEIIFSQYMTIMACRLEKEGWTAPKSIVFLENERAHEPHITLDGKKLYFGWARPTPEGFPKPARPKEWGDYGIYYCERTTEGWGKPKYAGYGMYVTSSRDGRVYITEMQESSAHIKRVIVENGIFVKFKELGGGLGRIHQDFPRTAHPSISPDGRTILFDVERGYGLFAAYLDESGKWSKPVNLCEHGLLEGSFSGTYSPDGKYYFFHNEGDVYWISSKFIERLRPDNQKAHIGFK